MKKCSRCHQTKTLSEFYRKERGIDGLAAECKKCNIARSAVRYQAKRAEIRKRENAQMVKTRKRIRDAVFSAYGGYVCACCGEKEQSFLTLDHIHNNGANDRQRLAGKRTAAGFQTYTKLVKLGFPPGYQVLCMNCNWGKRKTGVCPHKVRCNDYPQGVGTSVPKRSAPVLTVISGRDEDIVSPAVKAVAEG